MSDPSPCLPPSQSGLTTPAMMWRARPTAHQGTPVVQRAAATPLPDELHARLHRMMKEHLANLTDQSQVRAHLLLLVDRAAFWEDLADLHGQVGDDATVDALCSPKELFRGFGGANGRLAEKLATVSLGVGSEFYRKLATLSQAAGETPTRAKAKRSSPAEILSRHAHPSSKKAFLGARLADVAFVALWTCKNDELKDGFGDALVNLFIEGTRASYAMLAPLAELVGIKAPIDADLLPNGPLDFQVMAEELGAAEAGRARLIADARASKLQVYPPLPDEDAPSST